MEYGDYDRVILSESTQSLQDEEMDSEKPKWLRYHSSLPLAKVAQESNVDGPKNLCSKTGREKQQKVVKSGVRSVTKLQQKSGRIRTSKFAASTLPILNQSSDAHSSSSKSCSNDSNRRNTVISRRRRAGGNPDELGSLLSFAKL
jgi:hypothetical protein